MNPADLTISLADNPLSAATNGAANGLGLTGAGLGTGGKTLKTSSVPRIDTEPIYSALKTCIGERWPEYKLALTGFLLGKLNQTELTSYLHPILQRANLPPLAPISFDSTRPHLFSVAPTALHLHNALLSALYANALYRDAPAEPVASWVLATDAATASSSTGPQKGPSGLGDKIDDRNKREVMSLPARDRRRIKNVKEEAAAGERGGLREAAMYKRSLAALPSSMSSLAVAPPSTAFSSAGLEDGSDASIRRRFALPLASETAEFPSRENIGARIEPISAEEGLGAVASSAMSSLSELVENALEHYVKELVGTLFTSSRCDGEGLVQGSEYRRRIRKEERDEEVGIVAKDVLGRLPGEKEVVEKRRGLDGGDFRLAVRLEGGMWREDRFLGVSMVEEQDWPDEHALVNGTNGTAPKVNGVASHTNDAVMTNGIDHDDDGGNFGWAGGSKADRAALRDVLLGALAGG